MKPLLHILILTFGLIPALANEGKSAKVVAVIDGNTLEVIDESNETIKIVLAGIDSPELTQQYGESAKKFLEKIAMKKDVVLHFQGKDRKGNNLAVVLLKGEIDLRIELLKEGLAWTAEKDPAPELEIHKTEAQQKARGLWKDENPTPPWTHRRQQSMLQPKNS